jgi:glyoxylase-like metal-dependent hydrolase (beta-lactamase superfamily II)
MRFDDFGLAATALYTPGHSDGDVSLLLDDGEAFVGDIIQGTDWRRNKPEASSMVLSQERMLGSWRLLDELGVKIFHPAHGNSFSGKLFRQTLRSC